jgi:hypothetical protein
MGSGVLPDVANLTIERQRGTVIEDAHGSAVIDWSSPAKLLITGCWIGRPSGSEMINGRQTVIDEEWWYGPEDADVLETDRIRDIEADITYEVDGKVRLERDFDQGELTHKECQLKAITG